MKTRKYGVNIALAAVLLLVAVLIASCPDPLGSVDFQDKSPEQGYIRFNFGGDSRTIMPTYDDIDDAETKGLFVQYEVTISQGATEIFGPSDDTFATLNDLTTYASYPALTVSTAYAIKIDAYKTWTAVSAPSNVLAATGTYNIASAAAGPNNVTIALSTGSGTGTFTYNLSYNGSINFSSLTTATLGIYTDLMGTTQAPTLPGPGTFAPVPLGTTGAGSVNTLGAGTYYVKVSLTGATGTQSATYTEVLHIYEGLISAWGASGTPHNFPALQSNSHTVTLNNTTGVSSGTATGNVAHGAALSTDDGNIGTYFGATAPAPGGYTFNGWFPNNTFTAGEVISSGAWNISTNKVFRPQTLYAQWVSSAPAVGTWNVTFSLVDVGGGNLDLLLGSSTHSISSSGLEAGTSSVTLKVDEANLISPTYNWLYNGAPLTPTANSSDTFVFGYVSTNAFTENYLRPGIHTITLILVSDGKTYSENFTITVTP